MKISNLGKSALVGLGLSCGVASVPLTRANISRNETSLEKRDNLREKCSEEAKAYLTGNVVVIKKLSDLGFDWNGLSSSCIKDKLEDDCTNNSLVTSKGNLDVTYLNTVITYCGINSNKNTNGPTNGSTGNPTTNGPTSGPTNPPTPPPTGNPPTGNGSSGTVPVILGVAGVTAATVAGVLYYRHRKAHKVNQENVRDNGADIVIDIRRTINSTQDDNDNREVDIVECQANQEDICPPNYEDVVGLQVNQENDFTRDADIAISDRKDISSLRIFPPNYENVVGCPSNIEDNSNRHATIAINDKKYIKDKKEDK